MIVVALVVWALVLVFAWSLCRAAAPTWWERSYDEIDALPEADPAEEADPPQGRPSRD